MSAAGGSARVTRDLPRGPLCPPAAGSREAEDGPPAGTRARHQPMGPSPGCLGSVVPDAPGTLLEASDPQAPAQQLRLPPSGPARRGFCRYSRGRLDAGASAWLPRTSRPMRSAPGTANTARVSKPAPRPRRAQRPRAFSAPRSLGDSARFLPVCPSWYKMCVCYAWAAETP